MITDEEIEAMAEKYAQRNGWHNAMNDLGATWCKRDFTEGYKAAIRDKLTSAPLQNNLEEELKKMTDDRNLLWEVNESLINERNILQENSTCACGDVFNKDFKGICPNCVAELKSNLSAPLEESKINKATEWVEKRLKHYESIQRTDFGEGLYKEAQEIKLYLLSIKGEENKKL